MRSAERCHGRAGARLSARPPCRTSTTSRAGPAASRTRSAGSPAVVGAVRAVGGSVTPLLRRRPPSGVPPRRGVVDHRGGHAQVTAHPVRPTSDPLLRVDGRTHGWCLPHRTEAQSMHVRASGRASRRAGAISRPQRSQRAVGPGVEAGGRAVVLADLRRAPRPAATGPAPVRRRSCPSGSCSSSVPPSIAASLWTSTSRRRPAARATASARPARSAARTASASSEGSMPAKATRRRRRDVLS